MDNIVETPGYAFRQASRSTADGRHDHGIDVGARRNFEQEKASKKQAIDSKKAKEKEIERRKSMEEEVINTPKTTRNKKMEIYYKILEALKSDDDKKDPKKIVGGKTKVDIRPKTNGDVDNKGNPIKGNKSDIQEQLKESEHLKNYKRQVINNKDYHYFTHENGSSLLIKKDGDNLSIVHKDKHEVMKHFKDVKSLSDYINALHKSEDLRNKDANKKAKDYLRKKTDYKSKPKPPIATGWTSTKEKK